VVECEIFEDDTSIWLDMFHDQPLTNTSQW